MAKDTRNNTSPPAGLPVGALGLEAEIRADAMERLEPIPFGETTIEPRIGRESLWFFIGDRLALRAGWSPGGGLQVKAAGKLGFDLTGSLGRFKIELKPAADDHLIRVTTRFMPKADLLVPEWPRDLYPLDRAGLPLTAVGRVEAAQRGVNVGVAYFVLDGPAFGGVMYVQNLTALNPWFELTGTKPDGVVGGEWPELGYRPEPFTDKALPARGTVTFSDVLLSWDPALPDDDQSRGAQFLELLARIYRRLEAPETEFRDWPWRASRTLGHLQRSAKARRQYYGHLYLMPYTNGEYPDCMVQLSVAYALREYGAWRGRPLAIEADLLAGMRKFYDAELKTLRRYLPNVGEDKHADWVDSWYMYHPLLNLGRLALDGHESSRRLFFDSLEYGIRAAHRFKYEWPVMFDIKTMKVRQATRKPGQPGQSDVGGLYAYVMLQAYDLSGEKRYLTEARRGIKALDGWKFDLMYQANNTAWGALACIRLWRENGDEAFLGQAQVLFAGLFHNSLVWESGIGAAKYYPNFLGVTCLHDAPYMAIYECFEVFDAFEQTLRLAGDSLPDPLRLLLPEYAKHALNRAWFYFPDVLPPEIVDTEREIQSGEIDPKLSFPFEDIYADGEKPGKVGQEIYGSGAPFTFASRAFHRLPKTPFQLFSEYPLASVRCGPGEAALSLAGAADRTAKLRLLPVGRKPLGSILVNGVEPETTESGHRVFDARPGEEIVIRW